MAEIATIARPYAEALFKAAQADLPQTTQWLEELALVAADPALQQFAAHPKTEDQQVFDLLAGAIKTPLSENGKNFVRTVIDNGRLQALPEIAVLFRALVAARDGRYDAVVYSAFPMDDAALGDLRGVLEKRFGRQLNLSVTVEPELIGGVRVAVGDEVLDTSVKARLEQMKVALTA